MQTGRQKFVNIETTASYCGIEKFGHKTGFEIIRLLGATYSIKQINGSIVSTIHNQIYQIKFGIGLNKDFFLITKPATTKSIGTHESYLRPLVVENGKLELCPIIPERRLMEKICRAQGIPTSEKTAEATIPLDNIKLFEKILEKQNDKPFLFTETQGVNLEQLKKISSDQWPKIVDDLLTGGTKKDPIISIIFKSDLPIPNPLEIRPKNFMPYASHEIVATNSKTGKSTTAGKTGILIERGTPANLLGFSTANEKVEGSLNSQIKTVSIDEIQDSKNEEAYAGLSTYMEIGETEVRTGKAVVRVRGYASLRWMGNPKSSKEIDVLYQTEELFERFSDLLNQISKNNQAFGGRLSLIVFKTDVAPVDDTIRLTIDEQEKNAAIIEAVFQETNTVFSKLFLDDNVLDYLNKPLDENYGKTIEAIEEKTNLASLRELMEGHRILARKHIRGKALRLAFVDLALETAKGNLDLEELFVLADEYLADIQKINVESFTKLVDLGTRERVLAEYVKKSFENLPKHLKLIVESIKNQNASTPEITTFDWPKVFANIPAQGETGLSIQKIRERTEANHTRTNAKLEKCGLELKGIGENVVFEIKDKDKLSMVGGQA